MVPPTPPTYERSPVTAASLDDLEQDALETFLRLRAPTLYDEVELAQLGASVGVLAMVGGHTVPTVAGLLLFGRLPQLQRPEWGVSLVRVGGAALDDQILAREDLEGNIPSLLDGAEAFVAAQSRALPALASRGQARAEYPDEALRQVLLNALVHRDYRLTGKVAVRLFDERLEVWSPGGMLLQVPAEKLARRGGVSFPRNPLLASSLRLLGTMDSLGRGLPTIRRAMAEVTSTPVSFTTTHHDFLVTLPSPLGPQSDAGAGN